jgi:hypothetical protein
MSTRKFSELRGEFMQRNPGIVAIDGAGYWWRVFGEAWSMVPTNPDNEPIPLPVKLYRLVPVEDGRAEQEPTP